MLKGKIDKLTSELEKSKNNVGGEDNDNVVLKEISSLKAEMKSMFNKSKVQQEETKLKNYSEIQNINNKIKNHKEYAVELEKELENRKSGGHKYKRIPKIESDIRDNYIARNDSIDKVDNIYDNQYKLNRMGSRCPLLDKDASDEMKELNVACQGGLNNFLGLLPENQVGFTYMNPDMWVVPKKAYNSCPPNQPPSAVFDTGTPLNALDLTRVGSILPTFKYEENGYIDARTSNMKAADRISKDKDEFAGYSFSELSTKSSGGFAKAFPDKRFKILEDYKCDLDASYLRGMEDNVVGGDRYYGGSNTVYDEEEET
jgi:hypothetical protein